MMEKAILFNEFRRFKKYEIDSTYKRLYFGTEFCQKLIPAPEEVDKVLDYCKKKNLSFTFLTPLVTDSGLNRLDKLFHLLNRAQGDCEIVINDWGVLVLLNSKYKRLKPVLGRLMFGQRKDPRLPDILKEKQEYKVAYYQGTRTLFLPIPIPLNLKQAYGKSNTDFGEIRDFLINQRINRVEFENIFQGLSIVLPDKIRGSIYVPFGYISVTRICPMLTEGQKRMRISPCNKECQKYFWELRAPTMPKIIYKKGTAIFYKNTQLKIREWETMGIDRLVYEPELPI